MTARRSLRFGAVALALTTVTSPAGPFAARASGANPLSGPAKPRGSVSAPATSILGAAWNADNSPVANARLRLRNVVSGHIEGTAVANGAGQFAFANIEGGSYVVELVSETGKILAVGHLFTLAQGETVATFVRLAAKAPWFAGFFNNAAAAVAISAASQGITAIAPVAPPVSAKR